MKTLPLPGLLLSGLLLVLMSCSETPTGLDPANSNLYGAGIDAGVSLSAPQQVLAQAQGSPIVVRVPRQTVDALRDGKPTRAQVQASIRIGPDGTAAGALRWRSHEDGKVVFRAIEGRGIFDADGAFVRAEVAFELRSDGELVAATVTPSTSEPECLIWDLIGTTVHISFEASGEIHVRDAGR